MQTLNVALRDELVESLNKLISHTEEIYLSLAKSYPSLTAELEKSIAHSQAVAARFNRTDGPRDRATPATGIASLIAETREVIARGSHDLERMHQDDEKLFASLDHAIGRLSSLDQVIARIKEDSIEMELISLNAMTVALKAGSAGRAFSYITEELKRLSTRTISLTEQITNRGEELLEMFRSLRSSLEEVQTFQNRLFGEFSSRLRQSFDDFERGVSAATGLLSGMSSRSTAVRRPIMSIMEGIQLQDVIKQSIDHVIISLKELTEPDGAVGSDERLDELTFLRTLPELCHSLLEDVATQLKKSLVAFRQNLGQARSVIDEVESERSRFVATVISSNGAPRSSAHEKISVTELFEQSTTMLQSLLSDLGRSISLKANLVERSRALMNEVADLEDDFKSFSVLINRFHSIDIASRIEVVKQAVLQKMSGTVEEMTSLTERIERDVNESLDSTKSFIKSIGSTMSSFRKTFQDEESFVVSFTQDLRRRYDELNGGKNELSQTIGGFSLFTGSFLSLFQTTSKELERLESLLSDIARTRTQLDEIRDKATRELSETLTDKGMRNWELKSTRLQKIIQRFTIFTHKRTAGKLGGFEVEQGAESGTVTLF